jgi:hypothetical protein
MLFAVTQAGSAMFCLRRVLDTFRSHAEVATYCFGQYDLPHR